MIRPALPLGLAAAGLAAACGPGPVTPQGYELASIRPWNVVPRSSPDQMATAFARYCLADTPDATRAALRETDYAAVPRKRGTAMTFYVVDDRKPAVAVSETPQGRFCAVTARSRTGQDNRATELVARRFPGARPVDPARIGRRVERAWRTSGGDILFTQRSGADPERTSFTLALWRPA